MKKILTVARSEYLRAVGTKAFILGVVLMPVMFGGGIIALAIAENAGDAQDRHFAVIDRSGELYAGIAEAAEERNQDVFDEHKPDKQVRPRWVPEAFSETGDGGRPARLALSERVESGELIGFLELGADLLVLRGGEDTVLAWHTATPTYDDLPDWLSGRVNETAKQRRIAEADLDPQLVADLNRSFRVTTMGLTTVDDAGQIVEGEEDNQFATIAVPIGFVMLLFMLVMMSTPALMNNVLEEKMQRIAEVLVSAVTPFELLMGKLISAALVSFTLGLLYIGATLLFLHNMDTFVPGSAPVPAAVLDALGPGNLGLFTLFLALALVIYGSIFGALGAACSEIQDAQTLMAPAMLIFMLPMFVLGPVIKNPDGALATAVSFFPPATPIIMFLRVTMPPGVAWWELALALVTTVVFTLLCVGAAAKIFRVGVLAQGQTPSYRNLVSWIFSK